MEVKDYQCDKCKTRKGESNHWFKFTWHPDQYTVTNWDGSDYPPHTKHICSDRCLLGITQAWLDEQKNNYQRERTER